MSKSDKQQRKLDKRMHKYIDDIVARFPRESMYYLEQCLSIPTVDR